MTRSWWDSVDELVRHGAGDLVRRHSELTAAMDRWVESDNLNLARAALIHQERGRIDTDQVRLFAYCRRRSIDHEFFIRKAIGWALRS